MDLFDLTGRVALVTGASHGLGMAIAKGLAKAGASIAFNDILEDRLRNAEVEYRRAGVAVRAYRFDVTKEPEVKNKNSQSCFLKMSRIGIQTQILGAAKTMRHNNTGDGRRQVLGKV